MSVRIAVVEVESLNMLGDDLDGSEVFVAGRRSGRVSLPMGSRLHTGKLDAVHRFVNGGSRQPLIGRSGHPPIDGSRC